MALLLVAGPAIPLQPSGFQPLAAGAAPAEANIARWKLFGEAGVAMDLAALAANAPETALKLTLRGTLNLEDQDQGIAIISDESGRHARYQVGDELPGGARLSAISAGRVLLERNGQTEGLSLPREDGSRPAPGARPSPSAARGVDRSMPSPFINPMIAPGGPDMEGIRNATGIDAAELASQVQVFPVLENGRFAGVRLSAGRDSALFERSGLKPTDIVTAVNGIPLDGPQRQSELMNSLRDASSLQLTIRRDGREQQLGVDLK
ncbi:type II secretion system protein GspC [Aquimonas voraii]|uniref:type II secretion system protein GspC n=1 Tax=Aquimonas voraii TaxID=265719 RepID=UPI003CCBA7BD